MSMFIKDIQHFKRDSKNFVEVVRCLLNVTCYYNNQQKKIVMRLLKFSN